MFSRALAAALAVVFFMALPLAIAQTNNGRIEGTVQDPTGALVPGAKLTLVNTRTQARAETVSGSAGEYVFTALPASVYSLSVEAGGFRKAVIQAIELNVGMTSPQIVRLEVGSTSESVVVEANAVSVQTTESQVSRAVTMREIDTLPQLNRTPITIAAFQPGVQMYAGDVSYSRVNGLRQGSNNSKLDGIDVNDSVLPRLGLAMTANNVDSVGEFRIVLGGGKAEYGRSAGGQVELITRSGTNNFHGGAFDYMRNTLFHANDFFNNQSGGTRPKFIQNIFGASFGGRVLRDKTFFFGNYQGRRTKQESIRSRTVYTPTAKQGIFRWLSGGTVQSFNFAANAANADPRGKGVDAGVAKINAQMPDPNHFDLGDGYNTGGFRFNAPYNGMEDQYTIKVDHNITSSNRAFMRWSRQRNDTLDVLNDAGRTFPGQIDGSQGGTRWGFAIGDDWTIRPNLINEFRIGYQKAVTDFRRPNRPDGPAYITSLVTDVQYSGFPQGRYSPVIDITENLTWLKGKHVLKGGTSIRRTLQYGYNAAGTQPNVSSGIGNGNAVPATIGPAGLTAAQRSVFDQLYNDILGRVDRVIMTFYSDLEKFQAAGVPRVRNYKLVDGGFFFQDDWKASRKLTFNLGVRWEFFMPPKEIDTFQGRIDQAASVNGITPVTNLTLQRSQNWFPMDKNNFAPRLGFAYDLKGDGRTAIRGSFGVFYDRMMGTVSNNVDSSTPGFTQSVPVYPNATTTPATDVRFSDSWPRPQTPAAPVLTLPQTRSTNLVLMNPNLRTGYVQNFSLNVQRELIRNTVLDVGYVGNRGVKLFMLRDVNQPRITSEYIADFKTLQAFVANSATPVPASNVFVRIYGTPSAAVSALNATNIGQGRLGTVTNTLDTLPANFNRYAAAGLPSTYLRAYPQFLGVQLGVNDGRSYYDSLQVSIRRNTGALRTSFNYTWGHAIDNVGAYSANASSPEGNGYAAPIDNFNLGLMRGTADFDHRHAFNSAISYTLPIGKGKRFGTNMGRLATALIGGWDVGALTVWQTGTPYTVMSQRATGPLVGSASTSGMTWANYSGSKDIGTVQRRGDGIFWLTAADFANFSFPAAGEYGTSGRNSFTGPRFFNLDMSLVKKFRITEGHRVTFRVETYNTFNNPNFSGLAINLNTPATFGKLSSTVGAQGTSARVMQLSMRYDF